MVRGGFQNNRLLCEWTLLNKGYSSKVCVTMTECAQGHDATKLLKPSSSHLGAFPPAALPSAALSLLYARLLPSQ